MRALLTILLAVLLPLAACTPRPKPLPPGAIRAVVSIAPLKGLIEPLLPPGSTIEVLIPPGSSEHGYEIPSAQLAAILKADLVVWIGLGMEPQIDDFTAANPSSGRREIHFADVMGIKSEGQRPVTGMPYHGAPDVGHSEDDHHHDLASDPHMWLDPVAAQSLVQRVGSVLIALRPAPGVNPIQKSIDAQLVALRQLDADFNTAFASVPADKRTIVAAHDAYGWLAKRYNLTIVPIAGLNADEPKAADISRAVEQIKALHLTTVFTEPQLDPNAAKQIAQQTGAKLVPLDPLGDGDYFKMMRANLKALKEALSPPP